MSRSGRRDAAGRVVGIDLGASAIHAVALDVTRQATVTAAEVFAADEVGAAVRFCAAAAFVAIDAPSEPSTACHAEDPDVPARFRSARCGEIALARDHGYRVSWPTPVTGAPGWMELGFTLWAALRAGGHAPLEVYPDACFKALAGRRLATKRTALGLGQRREVLATHVELPLGMPMWGHDGHDALAAAVTAAQRAAGRALQATCGHDGSAIWLPVA